MTSMWEYDPGYTTKDSGERAEFEGGGQRDTEKGKPRFDLLLPETVPYAAQMLTRFAARMGRGAEKYEDRNWESFSDDKALQRARSSAFRHFMQWFNGETDEDHAAAVFFNIMAAEYIRGVLAGSWPRTRTRRYGRSTRRTCPPRTAPSGGTRSCSKRSSSWCPKRTQTTSTPRPSRSPRWLSTSPGPSVAGRLRGPTVPLNWNFRWGVAKLQALVDLGYTEEQGVKMLDSLEGK